MAPSRQRQKIVGFSFVVGYSSSIFWSAVFRKFLPHVDVDERFAAAFGLSLVATVAYALWVTRK